MRLARAVHALEPVGLWLPVSGEPTGAAIARAKPGRRGARGRVVQWVVVVAAAIVALAVGFVAAPRPYEPLPPGTPSPEIRADWATKSYTIGFLASDPAIDGGSVYAYGQKVSNGQNLMTVATRIYAFDASTGHIRWTLSQPVFNGLSPSPSIAVAGGNVYAFGTNGIYALSGMTGRTLWVHKNDDIASDLVASGTAVYVVGNNGNVYALNTADGATLWVRHLSNLGGSFPQLAFADHTVYATDGQGTLYALDATNGLTRWTVVVFPPSSIAARYTSTSPIVSGNTIYIGGNKLYALDAANGRIRWAYPTGDVVSGPVIGHGTVYSGTQNELYAIGSSTGKLRWTYPIAGAGRLYGVGYMTFDNGIVYVEGTDGAQYAIRASNGLLLWGYYSSSSPAVGPDVVVNSTVYVGSSNSVLGFAAAPP